MFCSKCGEKLPEGAKFCSHCGAKVEVEEEKTIEDDERTVLMPGKYGREEALDDSEETVLMSSSGGGTYQDKGRGTNPSALNRNQDLKYTENIIRETNRQPEEKPEKKKGGILFPILCGICIALAAGIAWQVWDIISVNRDLAAYETEHNKAGNEEEKVVDSSSTESISTAEALVTDPMLQERVEV